MKTKESTLKMIFEYIYTYFSKYINHLLLTLITIFSRPQISLIHSDFLGFPQRSSALQDVHLVEILYAFGWKH